MWGTQFSNLVRKHGIWITLTIVLYCGVFSCVDKCADALRTMREDGTPCLLARLARIQEAILEKYKNTTYADFPNKSSNKE